VSLGIFVAKAHSEVLLFDKRSWKCYLGFHTGLPDKSSGAVKLNAPRGGD
jgi:hypothetical protein